MDVVWIVPIFSKTWSSINSVKNNNNKKTETEIVRCSPRPNRVFNVIWHAVKKKPFCCNTPLPKKENVNRKNGTCTRLRFHRQYNDMQFPNILVKLLYVKSPVNKHVWKTRYLRSEGGLYECTSLVKILAFLQFPVKMLMFKQFCQFKMILKDKNKTEVYYLICRRAKQKYHVTFVCKRNKRIKFFCMLAVSEIRCRRLTENHRLTILLLCGHHWKFLVIAI